jgi:hypothetical protein
VVVSAFKKDSKAIYKLISFDIVKKTTSKRNSATEPQLEIPKTL